MSHLRRNLQILCGLILACDLALAGWLLSPKAPSQSATRQQLSDARVQLGGLKAELAQIRAVRARIHTSQQQMQQLLQNGFPGERQASSTLLTEFGRIAQQTHVDVSGATFAPDKAAQFGLRRVAINLQVAGGYEGAVQFLNGLERSPLFFLIDQVSASGTQTAGAATRGDQVRLDVKLEVYVQVQPANALQRERPGQKVASHQAAGA